jgi:hypothetical protein
MQFSGKEANSFRTSVAAWIVLAGAGGNADAGAASSIERPRAVNVERFIIASFLVPPGVAAVWLAHIISASSGPSLRILAGFLLFR